MLIDQIKRIGLDTILTILVTVLFLTGGYTLLPPAFQLLGLKVILVSIGFLHAHLIGKLAFPKVAWQGDWTPAAVLRIVLYVAVIYAYAQGG